MDKDCSCQQTLMNVRHKDHGHQCGSAPRDHRIAVIVALAYVVVKLVRATSSRFETFLIRSTSYDETSPGGRQTHQDFVERALDHQQRASLVCRGVDHAQPDRRQYRVDPRRRRSRRPRRRLRRAAAGARLWSADFFCCSRRIRSASAIWAIINGTGGVVKSVTFRTVALRDQAGVVHVFPNGSITTLANATMDWSAYVIDVAVSYNEDTDRVIDIMRRVADDMRKESNTAGR